MSPKNDRVRGWQHTDWGDEFPVDVPLTRAAPETYDALVLVSSRKPDDLPAFNRATLALFAPRRGQARRSA